MMTQYDYPPTRGENILHQFITNNLYIVVIPCFNKIYYQYILWVQYTYNYMAKKMQDRNDLKKKEMVFEAAAGSCSGWCEDEWKIT